jgi:alditol oxidase
MTQTLKNWAGNIVFEPGDIARPRSVTELQDVVRAAKKVRVLGSGHSFNRIADTDGTLVSLADLERRIDINREAGTVTVDGGATYADIAERLHQAGFALGNVASLPHITVVGAVCTATHGSGDANRNLSNAVIALTLVTATGDLVRFERGQPDFAGAVVNLGALGVVAEITLELIPTFDVRQNVYLDLPVATIEPNLDALMRRAYSVSLFTRWQGEVVDQVWVKAQDDGSDAASEILGARAAERAYHPIPDFDGNSATVQMGVVGPWYERLFHFPVGHKASAGAELQSECFVARADAAAAFMALHKVQEQFSPALFVSEVRSVAADDLWLSTAQGQDTIGFHFTWKPEWETTLAAVRVVEEALAPFNPRPHWAKVFTFAPDIVRARYPRLGDFRSLADRLDPERKFRNPFVDALLFQDA